MSGLEKTAWVLLYHSYAKQVVDVNSYSREIKEGFTSSVKMSFLTLIRT